MLQKEDFNNDRKDAGELGAGHTVTALYEVIPSGVKDEFTSRADSLKYQTTPSTTDQFTNEIMTIKLRYKKPDSDVSRMIEKGIIDENIRLDKTSDNFRFSAAVAEFGMLLRNSAFKQNANYNNVTALANSSKGKDTNGYRTEFIELVKTASSMPIAKN